MAKNLQKDPTTHDIHRNRNNLEYKIQDNKLQRSSMNLAMHDLRFQIDDLKLAIQDIDYTIDNMYTVTESQREILIELAADVLFDFDKANLKQSAVAALQKVAKQIKQSARGDVRIEGHTDSKGSNAYNQTLSEKRAESVRDWLVSKGGLANIQFFTKGFVETKPAVPNEDDKGEDDPSGRQRNRRVEIIINTAK